jgi:phosphoserine phosphatase
MDVVLQLNLRVASGRERELAEHLRAQVTGPHWRILATLAAELVQIHEAATGSTVVVVTGAAAAERVLRDLHRDQAKPVVPTV